MRAAIPTLVPADMLVKAGGWGNLVSSISDMIGPVLGAALMGFFPIAGIMLVDILGAAFAIICLLFVTIPDIPRSVQSSSFLSDFKLGIRAMRDNKAFIAVFLPMILVNTLYMPLGSLFPLLVKAHFMGNSWHNSMILFTFAGGTLVGSAVMGTWGGMKRRFLMASFAIGILGGCSLLGGALPSSGIWIFALCSFLMGVTGTFISIPVLAFIQESFAPEVLGKVFSLWITTMSIAMPLGLLMAGSISDMIGIDRWFIFSGIVLMATALLFRMLTNPYDKSGQA
jgi:DHA3 family macrolide efflux protein-like MFS transporter